MFQTKKQIEELQKNTSKEMAKEILEKDYNKVLELEESRKEAIKPAIKNSEQLE